MLVSKGRTIVFGMIFTSCVTGCASLGLFQTPEERVEQRSQARLDALLAGDMEKAFSFLSPEFRKTTSWQRYSSKYAGVVNWREVSVKNVECEVDRCDVIVSIRYQLIRPRVENTRFSEEVWIEVDGQWYFYAE
jgi:hypothetical protein